MKYVTVLLGVAMVAVLLSPTSAIPIDCMSICNANPQVNFLLCPCKALLQLQTVELRSVHPTPHAEHTTTDICDYLCSIQLGGEACHCTKPGLPGRK